MYWAYGLSLNRGPDPATADVFMAVLGNSGITAVGNLKAVLSDMKFYVHALHNASLTL